MKGGGGGCLPCSRGDAGTARSRQIDQKLRKEWRQLRRQVSVLLLGSGESGKSTFLKQMVIIHGRGEFTADEVRLYRQTIYQNVASGMRVLVDARQRLGYPWQQPERQTIADRVLKLDNRQLDQRSFAEIAPSIRQLWDDLAIRQTFEQRNLFQISDSCKYFFDNLARISDYDFVPTNRDILFCRKATRTIVEHEFEIQSVPFRFIDVGGQRSQRQKWFQCFESVTSILFVVASSEFDLVVQEDRQTNRILESRNVFETIVNNRAFASVPIILIMNKTDLLTGTRRPSLGPSTRRRRLAEKVRVSDIGRFVEGFGGDARSVKDVQKFLLALFDGARRDRDRPFFHHFTTAVDTDNIRRVFNDCREIILERNLRTLMMQ